jgi:hypothetical protein
MAHGRKLPVDSSITGSIPIAAATPGQKKAEDGPDSHSDGDGLVRMLMYGPIDRFGPLHGFVLGAFQRGGEALAGFPDFFSGYVGGGGHQSARVFRERAQVITCFTVMFIHNFNDFCLFMYLRKLVGFRRVGLQS